MDMTRREVLQTLASLPLLGKLPTPQTALADEEWRTPAIRLQTGHVRDQPANLMLSQQETRGDYDWHTWTFPYAVEVLPVQLRVPAGQETPLRVIDGKGVPLTPVRGTLRIHQYHRVNQPASEHLAQWLRAGKAVRLLWQCKDQACLPILALTDIVAEPETDTTVLLHGVAPFADWAHVASGEACENFAQQFLAAGRNPPQET